MYNAAQIVAAYDKAKIKYPNLHKELKDEQIETITHVLNKKDCLCCLPTGYGKSMNFALPPLLLDEVRWMFITKDNITVILCVADSIIWGLMEEMSVFKRKILL